MSISHFIPKISKLDIVIGSITIVISAVLTLFFVENNAIAVQKKENRLQELLTIEKQLLTDLEQSQDLLDAISRDNHSLEKYARERYFLKGSGEDIFIIKERVPVED